MNITNIIIYGTPVLFIIIFWEFLRLIDIKDGKTEGTFFERKLIGNQK